MAEAQLKTDSLAELDEYISPNLLECELAKKIVALQLASVPEEKEKIHVLMVGDPASGKSDLMNFILKCAPNTVKIDKRTTEMGLIEATEVSDRGIALIDEFDKLDRAVRQQLLEAMQDQVITIHKFRLHESFPRRMNILAACNPDNEILQIGRPIPLQIKRFSTVLLSRFHLIIPFKAIGEERYWEMAESYINKYEGLEELQKDILTRIIEMKQKVPKVVISKAMAGKCGEFIAFLKKASNSAYSQLISFRTVEGFMSCLKARARLNFRPVPNQEDFRYVQQIFEKVYRPGL